MAFLGQVWQLARLYWRSEERRRAWILLIVIVVLAVGQVGLSRAFNTWYQRFYDVMQTKDYSQFWPLIGIFSVLAGVAIVAGVYQLYFQQMLEMRWRAWLTTRFTTNWLAEQVYYRLELQRGQTDNPDQRIADDLRLFTSMTLSLFLGLLSSVLTLVLFVGLLWEVSGPTSFAIGPLPITIPAYLVWVAVLYALSGSLLTHWVGRRLIGLNFLQQRYEADFRFGLVRLRENAEGVALSHGEPPERDNLLGRFERVRANWWEIMRYTKRLTFSTSIYGQLAIIFPFLVAGPRYFGDEITLGVLIQISDAFGQVQGALSWFVGSYGSLTGWKASVDRLLTFQAALEQAAAVAHRPGALQAVPQGADELRAEQVTLARPDGQAILDDATFAIQAGDRVLITGPTGSGKSTLFRAIAGIWPFGTGQIQVPKDAKLLFLPQRPYLPLGTLRDVIGFPATAGTFTDDAIRDVLAATQLQPLAGRLDETDNWSMVLSGGEQQRLVLARALLHQPDWLFMDEATAALDDASEQTLYAELQRRLPNATIVSIAHHPNLAAHHQKHLTLAQTNGHVRLTEPAEV